MGLAPTLVRICNGLTTCVGTTKKVYGIMKKIMMRRENGRKGRGKTYLIRLENWHETEKGWGIGFWCSVVRGMEKHP